MKPQMSTTFQDFNRSLMTDFRGNGKATSGPFEGRDVLILTTKGAKSGDVRENPLVYTRDGDHYVIVASKGGAPTHPAWYHNLAKHPEVTVEVGKEKFTAPAHIPDGAGHDPPYTRHAQINPNFPHYPKRTPPPTPAPPLTPPPSPPAPPPPPHP